MPPPQARLFVYFPDHLALTLVKANVSTTTGFFDLAEGLYHHAQRLPGCPPAIVHLCLASTYAQHACVIKRSTAKSRSHQALHCLSSLQAYKDARLGVGTGTSTLTSSQEEPLSAPGRGHATHPSTAHYIGGEDLGEVNGGGGGSAGAGAGDSAGAGAGDSTVVSAGAGASAVVSAGGGGGGGGGDGGGDPVPVDGNGVSHPPVSNARIVRVPVTEALKRMEAEFNTGRVFHQVRCTCKEWGWRSPCRGVTAACLVGLLRLPLRAEGGRGRTPTRPHARGHTRSTACLSPRPSHPHAPLQLGLHHLAIPAYRRVLDLGDTLPEVELNPVTTYMAPGLVGDVHSSVAGAPPLRFCYDIRREAAWNMVCILRKGGNVRMAQGILRKYLTLD